MKKIFFILISIITANVYGQDSVKVSELTATTSLDSADIFYVIDGGTSKKVLWYYMAQTGFPVDVRTAGAGSVVAENFWIGEDAGLNFASGGVGNYSLGTRSLYNLTSGSGNNAFGFHAGYGITNGYGNFFGGLQAGYGVDTSGYNLAIGYQPMYAGDGFRNITLGFRSGYNLDGSYNLLAGWLSGHAITSGNFNTVLGSYAGDSLTTASYSTFLGGYAGQSHKTTDGVTYLGYAAGRYVNAVGNTAVGYQAMRGTGIATGTYNSTLGEGSMLDLTTGTYNTGLGALALANITTGGSNVALGAETLETITTQSSNVAIGYKAMEDGTPSNSIAIGHSAGEGNNSSGSIFIGLQAGVFNTSGVNTAIGHQAFGANTTGTRNTILGYQTQRGGTCNDNLIVGYQAATNGNGDRNTILGSYAGSLQTTADGVIKIGYKAGYNDNTDSTLWIDVSPNSPLLYGDFSVDSLVVNGDLTIRDDVDGEGIHFYADYSDGYTDRSAVDYEYTTTHLAGKDLNSAATDPDATDHGGVITYDSTGYAAGTDHYTLTNVVDVASAAGMLIVAIDTVLYSNTSQTTIITLPAAAVVWDVQCYISQPFNGSGTDLLDIGITGDGDRYEDDLDLSAGAGFVTMVPVTLPDRMSASTNVTFQYFDAGADASSGEAYVYIRYSIH